MTLKLGWWLTTLVPQRKFCSNCFIPRTVGCWNLKPCTRISFCCLEFCHILSGCSLVCLQCNGFEVPLGDGALPLKLNSVHHLLCVAILMGMTLFREPLTTKGFSFWLKMHKSVGCNFVTKETFHMKSWSERVFSPKPGSKYFLFVVICKWTAVPFILLFYSSESDLKT